MFVLIFSAKFFVFLCKFSFSLRNSPPSLLFFSGFSPPPSPLFAVHGGCYLYMIRWRCLLLLVVAAAGERERALQLDLERELSTARERETTGVEEDEG